MISVLMFGSILSLESGVMTTFLFVCLLPPLDPAFIKELLRRFAELIVMIVFNVQLMTTPLEEAKLTIIITKMKLK